MHFHLILNFYDIESKRIAFTYVAYNMHKAGNPRVVDAPIRIRIPNGPPECQIRPPSISENVIAEHFVFKLARKNLIIVDGFTIDYSTAFNPQCYDKLNWDGLLSGGTISKMRLRVQQILGGHEEPVSEYLSFWYRINSGKLQVLLRITY